MLVNFSKYLKLRRDKDPDHLALLAISKGGRERERGCAQLYERYGASVRRKFMAAGLDCETADELFQEVIIKVVVNCEQFTPEQPFRVWLFSIANNTYSSHMREGNLRRQAEDAEILPLQSSLYYSHRELGALSNFGLRDCVRRAFLAFERSHPKRAEAMTLSVLEGLCSKEVARFLNRSDPATREYLRQCRIKMRSYFGHCFIYLDGEET
ncbi:RNA polymerase sigma factor [Massilia glaciei]|uniref:RNA polymerase sigma factor n=1 Tax=Massilia glaciei TaxID=1524097 RepID=A0A2U2I5X5_9BURK|nr:RNA polymerase sigma factor [Massilia glaciei]PWF55167.1 RNA polymerase sigma factor [Massilia glaciei]